MQKPILFEGQETGYTVNKLGEIHNKNGRLLRGTNGRNGYNSVQLSIGGKVKTFMTHRLVAEAFCPNPNNYTIVHHIDGDNLNNKAENLQWVTTKENNQSYNKKSALTRRKVDFKYADGTNWTPLKIEPSYQVCEEGYIAHGKRVLAGTIRNGYVRVDIKRRNMSVHRLVYETFKGEIKGVIDHIDGNKENNNISNLRDVTQSENMINAQLNGHGGQVPVNQYDLNGNFINRFNSFTEAAKEFGVSYVAIKDAADRKGSSCGFYWTRDGELPDLNKPVHRLKVKVIQLSENKEVLQEFESYAAAGRAIGKARQNIAEAVKTGHKCGGFYWIKA